MAASNQGNKQSSGTKNRGFASMDPERQRQIASQGGKAAHEKGTAHEFTSEEARRAGSMSHGNRQSANSSSSRSSSKGNKQEREAGRLPVLFLFQPFPISDAVESPDFHPFNHRNLS
jgi:general stress protein YciG